MALSNDFVTPQVGTATLNLQQLLRQGRDFSELLIEVPIMDNNGSSGGGVVQAPNSDDGGLLGQSVLAGKQGAGGGGVNDSGQPTILSKGSIVLRIINIGREPRNPTGG
jgi:nephrocystin-4